jgi:hypothetical protein
MEIRGLDVGEEDQRVLRVLVLEPRRGTAAHRGIVEEDDHGVSEVIEVEHAEAKFPSHTDTSKFRVMTRAQPHHRRRPRLSLQVCISPQ